MSDIDTRLFTLNVNDRQCLHVTYDGKRCQALSSLHKPHGWLCDYHDGMMIGKARLAHPVSDAPREV